MTYTIELKRHMAYGVLFFLTASMCNATEILQGNIVPLIDTSFNFPLKTSVSSFSANSVYVGAKDNGAQDFALSAVHRITSAFSPLAPATVQMVNDQVDQPNPLFNKGIKILSLIESGGEHPIIVINDEPTILYMYNNFNATSLTLFKSTTIPDATGAINGGIAAIDTHSVQGTLGAGGAIFAAVQPSNGCPFGSPGSGIALLLYGIINNTESLKRLAILDAPTGEQGVTQPKAAALDKTSSFLKNTTDLADILNNAVALHVNPFNGLLYIGLQIQTGVGGGRAIAVAQLAANNALTLKEIIPYSALTGTNKIVGTGTDDAGGSFVSINEIKSMRTSTAVLYLIVRGGNGDAAATQNMIYALPLVSGSEVTAQNGTIATKDGQPVDVFTPERKLFVGRIVTQQATDTTMPSSDDNAVLVGGGPVTTTGTVNQIAVVGDTVFASVSDSTSPSTSGVYYSQALFTFAGQSNGIIQRWTQWRRYAGITDPVFALFVDSTTGLATYLTGADASSINTGKRTQWSLGSLAKSQQLDSALGQPEALFDIPVACPAVNNITLLMSTPPQQVTIAQSGATNGAVIIPTSGAATVVQNFTDGSLGALAGDATVLTVSGGALAEIAPLTAVELARAGNTGGQAWFFCAGFGGLAVLTDVSGGGISGGQLGAHFAGLQAGMSFKKLGNYAYVRKVVSDGNFVYVLTDKQLDRINLAGKTTITPENVEVTTIARAGDLVAGGSFLDIIVSNKLALLGTSQGLLRVASGSDITGADVQWKTVPLAEGVGPATQLFAVSITARAQDMTNDVVNNGGGNVYVLNNNPVQNRCRVQRFEIAVLGASAITDQTVIPFADMFVQGVPSYYTSFGQSRDWFVTDGALTLHARARELAQLANVKILPLGSRQGNESTIAPVSIIGSNALPIIVHSSASGSWVIGTNEGVQVNE